VGFFGNSELSPEEYLAFRIAGAEESLRFRIQHASFGVIHQE
jgi:hypothetical protein